MCEGKKYCKGCGITKSLSQFSKRAASKDGKQPLCKVCDRHRTKSQYQKKIKHYRKKRREWQDNNRELHILHVKNYYARKRLKNKEEDDESLE